MGGTNRGYGCTTVSFLPCLYLHPTQSYGGHYVPWLAKAVLDYNTGKPQNPINLKGFMAGNPWTDTYSDNSGTASYWWVMVARATPGTCL